MFPFFSNRITQKAPFGEQIELVCKNHPDLKWHTKNIGCIGGRSIFFDMRNIELECDCNISQLIISPKYQDMPDISE